MKKIINMDELLETLSPKVVDFALKEFQQTEPEDGMICSNYDEEGYCTFEHIDGNLYEFTGTAK